MLSPHSPPLSTPPFLTTEARLIGDRKKVFFLLIYGWFLTRRMQREATKHAQKTLKWFSAGPRWGSLRRSPKPPSGLGRGYPLPIPHPSRRFRRLDLRRLRRLEFGPPTFQIKVTPLPMLQAPFSFTCKKHISRPIFRPNLLELRSYVSAVYHFTFN